NGIGVNAGDSKLMLLGINLLLLGKVNAARHNLLLLVVKTVNEEQQLQALVDRKKIIITEATRPRKPKRKDTEIPQSSVPVENVVDEAVYEERDDSLERATTTATGLDVDSGGGPRHQDTMGDTIAQTRSENVSKFSNDPLLAGGRKIHDIDADEDITLENVHDADMFGVHDLDGDEVFVKIEEPVVNAATTTSTISVSAAKDLSDVDMTLS
ncbi:hypothetical protein Tco_1037169, partial [Tanacetum coccineum]